MKFFRWCKNNLLLLITLFLLAFIPLYPKLPLLGVTHTFVYIRLDDIFVALADFIFFILLLRKKATLKTPLTVPFFIFWGIGLISTLYAILFIFPHIANVFPNVAWLTYLRHIEYLGLFFVAFSAIKHKDDVRKILWVLSPTVLAVALYGFGQKYLGFPAFLTMNEEFAKGIPLRLSPNDRIPSTFAGHYDLAAWLVIVLPILASMMFAFKNLWVRIGLFICGLAGLSVLLLTASRVSFMMYVVTIVLMLIFQKQKKWILPFLIFSFLYLQLFQGISSRFTSTLSSANVVYDARTGKAIGIAKAGSNNQLVIENKDLTGENLPQGSGYINLPSSETGKTVSNVLYKRTKLTGGKELTEQTNLQGNFVVKRALAYDVSFTTRFQGEWPRAIQAFLRNPLLGSGYSSISLATDNNYLRMFGEVGILGFVSFFLIFIFAGIYISKLFPKIGSVEIKSFIIGLSAGVVGLVLNAVLIDVFEASKVAYVLWLLVGAALGLAALYKKEKINYLSELKNLLLSKTFIILYIMAGSLWLFYMILNNFFVGDDFIWLKWAAECNKVHYISGITTCEPITRTILHYFTNSQGFFYRPGTKTFFFFWYAINWLNPQMYHLFSIFMHALTTALVFLISAKLLKSKIFGLTAALLFLVLSAHAETIFWIASVGHLVASFLVLFSLYLFIQWKEHRNYLFLAISFLSAAFSLLFHEMGTVAPFLIIAYDLLFSEKFIFKKLWKKWFYIPFLLLLPLYAVVKTVTHSQWFFGDYSYNIVKFPYNAIGNALGYLGLVVFGTRSIAFYDSMRQYGKSHIVVVALVFIVFIAIVWWLIQSNFKSLKKIDLRVPIFALCVFVIGLLPFLGLGNIAARYVYLPSFGVILFATYLLHKLFFALKKQEVLGKIVVLAIVLLFVVFNILELQRINQDWIKAGSITNNLLVSLQNTYTVTRKATGNPVFYFADTPIKWGEAWVFPVGLPEAVWFDFQGENLTVHQVKSIEEGLRDIEASPSARLFDFNKNGDIEQITSNGKLW